ncbi:MAG: hypothetical protein LBD93_04940 [Treponema sp.]|nr:hypothetical protein [Treponema sp.]
MEGHLKQCPFCGAHGAIDTLNRADGTCGAYRVQCQGCGVATRWCGTQEAARGSRSG